MGASARIFREGLLAGQAGVVPGGGADPGVCAARVRLARGASGVVAGRRPEILEGAASELGDGCSWVAGDIREPEAAARIVASAVERCGRLDLLVNNAGGQYFVPAEGITGKGWQ